MISAQTRSAFVARENRRPLFRIMLWQKKSPGASSGAFFVVNRHQVRVRIRIMKLSKLSSATCIQAAIRSGTPSGSNTIC